MATPIRERLLSALTTAVAGEYGIPAPEDERDLPVTIVQDGADEAGGSYGVVAWTTPVAIGRAAAAVDTSAMTPTAARAALRAQAHDMLAALWVALEADPTFGGLADGVDPAGQSLQTELGQYVFAELSIRVRWHHVRGSPDQIDE